MKILITGSKGQLGRALISLKPYEFKVYPMDRTNFDMMNIPSCLKTINLIKPDWIINCAAYTDVGLAEFNDEIAMKVNCFAATSFAEEIKKLGGNFLQISTDYVFDGRKNPKTPYSTTAQRSPLGVYGLSKAKAEEAIERIFQNSYQGIILRTSWLIGPVGKNFLLTILNLHLKNESIKVVNDQIGSPTSTLSLAKVIWEIIKLKDHKLIFKQNENRILHWQDNGETNWYEIALTISDLGKDIGLIKKNIPIIPIKSSQYPSNVQRPFYSVLECDLTKKLLNYEGMNWKITLKEILEKLQLNNNQYLINPRFRV